MHVALVAQVEQRCDTAGDGAHKLALVVGRLRALAAKAYVLGAAQGAQLHPRGHRAERVRVSGVPDRQHKLAVLRDVLGFEVLYFTVTDAAHAVSEHGAFNRRTVE